MQGFTTKGYLVVGLISTVGLIMSFQMLLAYLL